MDETPKTVAECIVTFLSDMLSGTDIALRSTQDHDGPRVSRHEDETAIWVNAPIGDPDDSDSLDGETFEAAMIDVIRREGTPDAIRELESALHAAAVSPHAEVDRG